MNLETYFKVNFSRYKSLAPSAAKIHRLLENRDEIIVNDHIALRTINLEKISKEHLAEYFINQGYEIMGKYHFKEKKLNAIHLEKNYHPKVFISELISQDFSENLQLTVKKVLNNIPEDIDSLSLLNFGRKWDLSYKDYLELEKESAYAAWFMAIGFFPNHFTIDLNSLKSFLGIRELNDYLKNEGFKLNESGGEIKGSPSELLEQSSTMADKLEVQFTEGMYPIPTCYYEFAKRYEDENGKTFQGFVTKSADKIFESTNS